MKKLRTLLLTGLILALFAISSISAFASDEHPGPKELDDNKPTTSSSIFVPFTPSIY